MNPTDDPRSGWQRTLGGAALILFGTAAAIISIPTNYQEPGGLLLTSVIQSAALLAPLFLSRTRDIRSLLRGENVLLLSLVYWVLFEMLQGAFVVQATRQSVEREVALLGLTGLGFWLGANLWAPWRPKMLIEESRSEWSKATIFRLVLIAFFLGAFDFFYRAGFDPDVVISSLLLPRFEAPWQREQLGDWSAFSAHLIYFGYTVPSLAMLCALRSGFLHPYSLISFALALATVLLNSQGGGRRIIGVLILSALFCWLIEIRRMTVRRMVLLSASVVALLFVMQIMLVYRNIGYSEIGVPMDGWGYFHVDGNFVIIAYLLEFVPDTYSFVGWDYVLWAVVRPIPRVFWPDKPTDGGFDLAEVLGIPNTSVAISIAGELYLSYGFVATIVGSAVYGRFASLANGLFEDTQQHLNPVFPSILLVWLFVGVRSMLEIMLLGYVLLAILLLARLSRGMAALRRGAQAPS